MEYLLIGVAVFVVGFIIVFLTAYIATVHKKTIKKLIVHSLMNHLE